MYHIDKCHINPASGRVFCYNISIEKKNFCRMKNWSDVAKFAVGALVAYNAVARNQKRRVEPTTPTISSKPMYEFPNNGGL